MREQNLTSKLEELEKEVYELAEKFDFFATGYRVILMIHRSKDGGSNKESRRVSDKFVYKDKEHFIKYLYKALWLKLSNSDDLRIYLSVNRRDLSKSIQHLEKCLLDIHYSNSQENKENLYHKVFTDSRTFLMQPSHKVDKYFLLDVDNEESKDVLGDVLKKISENGIEEVFRTSTRNGWHIITTPFNPELLGEYSNIINKDGLILLK